MNPNSRYEEKNISLELKQARANLRQAAKAGHQVKKSQAERHIWALKGLFKSVTNKDPPRTESDSSLSGMEDETEEKNTEAARVFMKVKKGKAHSRKQERNGERSSNKRKTTSTGSYSRPAKVTKVVSQGEKEDQSDGSSDSSQSSSESEEEDEEEEELTKSGRNKFFCPLRCSSKAICQLPRHLVKVHQWDKERARNAVNHYDLRHDQRNSKKPKYVREKRKKKYCIECGRKERYLSKHLQKIHGYKKGTKKYWNALKESRPVHQWRNPGNLKYGVIDSDTESSIHETAVKTTNLQLLEKNECNTGRQGIHETPSTSLTVDTDEITEKEDGEEMEGSGDEQDEEYLPEDDDEDECGEEEEVEMTDFKLNQESSKTFDKFKKWILSPDGGEKDPKPATLVVRQVEKILMTLGTDNIESLFDKALIRDKFYPESRAAHKAGTTISYLHSLRKFYTFATTEDDIGISQKCQNAADVLYKKCGEWCKTLRKEVKERFWEKQEEDLKNLITPEKIHEFAKTEFARNQVKTIGQLIENHNEAPALGQKEYCDLRNFLFIHILSQNGHRSGVLTNSTLAEYKKMTCVDGTYMVAVKEHKTFSQHGQANLCFDESLKAWVDIYVDHARSQVATGNESSAFFLNWKGGKMSSSDLSTALTSAWRKAGMIGNDTRISGTLLRKSCTTAIRTHNKEAKGNVAAHMAHSERTADKHYHLVQKRTNSAFAAQQLTAIMHGRASPMPSNEGKDCEADHSDVEPDFTPIPLERQSWTEEEEKAIKEVFADQISRQSVTMREVLDLKKTNELLVNCQNKRLLDKVKGFYRFQKESACVEVMQTSGDGIGGTDSVSIISPSTNQSNARVFKEEEVAVLRNLFNDMIQRGKKIEQNIVIQRLKDNGHGQICDKYSKQKVTDKVRGLRTTYIRQWRK